MRNIIAGIDIGTSKVCAAVGRMNEKDEINVLGEGIGYFSGLKKGRMTDIGEVASAIKEAVARAEKHAKTRIVSAFVAINGMDIEIIKRQLSIVIENNTGTIRSEDVYRILNLAKDVALPEGKDVMDLIVKNYKIDDKIDSINPVGIMAKKLDLTADLIIADIVSMNDIKACMRKAGIDLEGFVPTALAESGTVLTGDEKSEGCILIDTGAGVTDISVFKNNSMIFNDSVTLGGENITNDLSIVLKTSYNDAEKIKKQYGLAKSSLIKSDHEVLLSGQDLFSQTTVQVSEIIDIIEARVREIFELSAAKMADSEIDLKDIHKVVLTGEGIALFTGSTELSEEIFGIKTRTTSARPGDAINPRFYASAGIIKYVSETVKNASPEILTMRGHRVKRRRTLLQKIKGIFN